MVVKKKMNTPIFIFLGHKWIINSRRRTRELHASFTPICIPCYCAAASVPEMNLVFGLK